MTDKYEGHRRALLSNLNWLGLSDEVRNTIVEAEITLGQMRSRCNIDDWLVIGHACLDLQQAAMRPYSSTNANGHRYGDTYNLLAPPHLRDMDKSDRREAIQLYQNGEEIRAWYFDKEINSQSDRDRMQHPQTILATFDAYRKQQALTTGKQPDEPGDGKRRPGEQRRKCSAAAAIDGADERANDLRNTVNDIQWLTGVASLELDPTPAGMIHLWETLIGRYGLDDIIDLFKVGLERSEPQLLAGHIEELCDIIEAIASEIEDDEPDDGRR